MIVAYFHQQTGEVHSILTGPSLEGMPEPATGDLATMTDYVGQLPAMWNGSEVQAIPPKPSPGHVWDWPTKTWNFDAATEHARLEALSAKALSDIDDAAGRARLKYITSVPGQSETYQRKEQQARDWKADGFAGDAPSFIAAEAQALGIAAVDLANQVIGLADYWANVKGPEIEACRRKWKVAVDGAGLNETAINAAHDGGIQALVLL